MRRMIVALLLAAGVLVGYHFMPSTGTVTAIARVTPKRTVPKSFGHVKAAWQDYLVFENEEGTIRIVSTPECSTYLIIERK